MSTHKSRAIGGALTSILQYILFITLQVILTPMIIRIAGKEVLGAYSIIMQIMGYGILLDLGFSAAVIRFLSQNYSNDSVNYKFKEIFNIGRSIIFISNGLFSIILIYIGYNIKEIVKIDNNIYSQVQISIYLIAFWIFIKTPISLYNSGLIATHNMVASNYISILSNLLRMLISILLVYQGLSIIGLVISGIISELVAFLLQRYIFISKFNKIKFSINKANFLFLKSLSKFGLNYWGVNLAGALFLGSDSIIIGNIFGADIASVFYTTKIPTFLLIQFIYKISDNSSPAINQLFSEGGYPLIIDSYYKILRYSLLLAFPLAIGLVGFNYNVITLWVGPNQYAGNLMTYALSFFVITQVINHLNSIYILAIGQMKYWSVFSIVNSIAYLSASYFLAYNFGMQWVMIAMALMDFPNMIFIFKRIIEGLKLKIKDILNLSVIPALKSSIVLVIYVCFIKLELGNSNVMDLFINIFIFVFLWLFYLFKYGLSQKEKLDILNYLKNINILKLC